MWGGKHGQGEEKETQGELDGKKTVEWCQRRRRRTGTNLSLDFFQFSEESLVLVHLGVELADLVLQLHVFLEQRLPNLSGHGSILLLLLQHLLHLLQARAVVHLDAHRNGLSLFEHLAHRAEIGELLAQLLHLRWREQVAVRPSRVLQGALCRILVLEFNV